MIFPRSPMAAAGVALCLAISLPSRVAAQSATGDLTGVVRDSTAGTIAGAEVRATHTASGLVYRTLTGSRGAFWLRDLPPGRYEISAGGAGRVARRAVTVEVGGARHLDLTVRPPVELAPLAVEVRAADRTSGAEISYVLDHERIATLPEESRQFIELAQLVPGVTAGTAATGGPSLFGTNGSSAGALNRQSLGVLVDGVDFTEGLFGDLAGSLPLLAIREFEVATHQYGPEMGRAASGVVNVATRRGANDLTVEGFGLFRDRVLSARGTFEAEKPDFSRSHWGLAAGGPIVRDRTHFFVAVERRDQHDYATVNTAGAFPAYDGTFETPFTDNLLFARLDHRLNPRHELTLRYLGEIGEQLQGVGGVSALEHGQHNRLDMHSVLLAHRWSSISGWQNDARLHVISTRRSLLRNAETGPTLIFPGLQAGPRRGQEHSRSLRIELRDDLSRLVEGASGSHRLQFGAHLSWLDDETNSSFFELGWLHFATDADTLPDLLQLSFRDPAVRLDARNLQVAVYARDDWGPWPDLTLTLGLRYDVETNGSNQDFVSPFAKQLPFVSSTERPVDGNNLAPRLGFAWKPAGDEDLVLRGGFGVFYDALVAGPLVALERSSGVPFLQLPNPGTTDIDALMVDPDTVPPIVWTSPKIRTGLTRQYSLGVQRALPGDVVLRLDGVLVQGRDLLLQRNLNPRQPGGRPYPGFSRVTQIASEGRADAKMLLVHLEKRFGTGWFEIGYTLADRKNTNDSWEMPFVPQTDPAVLDLDAEWGPAAWDERHRLVATGGGRLPAGLGLAVKLIYSSGRPFTGILRDDVNGDGSYNDRPEGASRNSYRGPDFFRTDLGLTWDAPAWGAVRLGLTLNVYNLFDTVNGIPEDVQYVIGSSSFGEPLAAYPGRQAELGLRVAASP